MVVLVTGSNGQLGQSLQFIAKKYPALEFVFCDSTTLDITNLDNVEQIFNQYQPHFCINAAAYTAVDKAESEEALAIKINVDGAKNIAQVCKKYDTVLLHVSTDFVFDGDASKLQSSKGYTEQDIPNPTGVYGQTKLDGEKAVQNTWEKHFIVRTSWVYSEFANNFMKTMLRLAKERDTLSVVSDQIGTPTYAVDLVEALLKIITTYNLQPAFHNLFGIYNFSNEGQCSWFDFAKKIFEINSVSIELNAIPTSSYPTPAKRPLYSVLDKSKIKKTFHLNIKKWEESLQPFPLN